MEDRATSLVEFEKFVPCKVWRLERLKTPLHTRFRVGYFNNGQRVKVRVDTLKIAKDKPRVFGLFEITVRYRILNAI